MLLQEANRDQVEYAYRFGRSNAGQERSRAEWTEFKGEPTFADTVRLYSEPCNYCKMRPSMGIDRYDNDKAYEVTDNLVSCDRFCNQGKHCVEAYVFTSHCKRIKMASANTIGKGGFTPRRPAAHIHKDSNPEYLLPEPLVAFDAGQPDRFAVFFTPLRLAARLGVDLQRLNLEVRAAMAQSSTLYGVRWRLATEQDFRNDSILDGADVWQLMLDHQQHHD